MTGFFASYGAVLFLKLFLNKKSACLCETGQERLEPDNQASRK